MFVPFPTDRRHRRFPPDLGSMVIGRLYHGYEQND